MKRLIGFGVAAGAAAWAVSRVVRAGTRTPPNRWLFVTVNRPSAEVSAALPEPVARLSGTAEVCVRPAPGGRGTELGLRLRDARPTGPIARLTGTDPRQDLRTALREAKSLLETGEVLRPDGPPTTRRTKTGKVLELATRRAGGEGRL